MKSRIIRLLLLTVAAFSLWAKTVVPGPRLIVGELLSNVEVKAPLRYENLTIFPLSGDGPTTTSFLTLEQAIGSGQVLVQEKGSGQVNLVRMQNRGKTYVFGMAGEIVSGAKQDRMLQDDILLPPNSGWLDVPVYCTEHGRWHGSSLSFGTRGQMVAGCVRKAASLTESQTEVWQEVDEAHARVGCKAPSHAFARVYDDAKVKERAAPFIERLQNLVSKYPDAQGVLVAVGSRVLCVDLFGSKGLFRKMWPKLLRSYVIDALGEEPEGSFSEYAARRFIRTATGMEVSKRNTPGAGELYRISASNSSGSALLFMSALVHLDLFPEQKSHLTGPEDEGAPRLEIRRHNSRLRE
ncbi:MAG: DUF6569 family protein [candidate division WOR-3 bacterium]